MYEQDLWVVMDIFMNDAFKDEIQWVFVDDDFQLAHVELRRLIYILDGFGDLFVEDYKFKEGKLFANERREEIGIDAEKIKLAHHYTYTVLTLQTPCEAKKWMWGAIKPKVMDSHTAGKWKYQTKHEDLSNRYEFIFKCYKYGFSESEREDSKYFTEFYVRCDGGNMENSKLDCISNIPIEILELFERIVNYKERKQLQIATADEHVEREEWKEKNL